MLKIGEETPVRFKVSVLGTSAPPSVSVTLNLNPMLAFEAQQEAGTDFWVAKVKVPETVDVNFCRLGIQVIVNKRIFTPYNEQHELVRASAPAVEVPPKIETPAEPTVETVMIRRPELEQAATEASQDLTSLMASINSATKSKKLKPQKTAPLKFERPVLKPKAEPKPLLQQFEQSHTISRPAKAEVVESTEVKSKPTATFELIKEDIIYE